jgi:hypothetical protein
LDDEFIADLEKLVGPQGINVRLELEKAKVWLLSNPHRKLTRKFFTSWICKAQPDQRTLAAAKREDGCDGERPCPVYGSEEARNRMLSED